eukprot:3558147-Pyramimonas_sp.AAC.1
MSIGSSPRLGPSLSAVGYQDSLGLSVACRHAASSSEISQVGEYLVVSGRWSGEQMRLVMGAHRAPTLASW